MPNWCYNTIEITGSKDNISKLLDTITNDTDKECVQYTLTNCMPVPKEMEGLHEGFRKIDDVRVEVWYEDEDGPRPMLDMVKDELMEKYGSFKPIEWQYRNWGTKWGDCDTRLHNQCDEELTIAFDSAWGQPFLLLQHIATEYNVQITNTYEIELGNGEGVSNYPWQPEEDEAIRAGWSADMDSLERISEDIVKD